MELHSKLYQKLLYWLVELINGISSKYTLQRFYSNWSHSVCYPEGITDLYIA